MKPFKKIRKLILVAALIISIVFAADCSNEKKDKNNTKGIAELVQTKNAIAANDPVPVTLENKSTGWKADAAHAQIKFRVKGPFGIVNGSLSDLRSTINFDENDLASSSIVASVAPKTINTGVKKRDADLQKEKYFASDQYPKISFRSQKFKKTGTGYDVTGTLTIKNTSRTVNIPFTFDHKGNNGIFKGQFTIQRDDYGVGKTGGLLKIGQEITVNLVVPVIKV